MSLFGALGTAVSGLSAQAAAFTDISDNVANSQTVGFKRIDTAFGDYLTSATATEYQSGSTVARPVYENTVQGSVTQSDNPLAFAITGNGFFSVSRPTQDVNGKTTFSPQIYYTRQGDFQQNSEGYLVNSSGDYLNGWAVTTSGGVATVERNAVTPIQITNTIDAPVATSTVSLDANLPTFDSSSAATSVGTITSTVDVYDAQGATHTLTLSFVPDTAAIAATVYNTWDLNVTDDGLGSGEGGTAVQVASTVVQFGADGTLHDFASAYASLAGTYTTGASAALAIATSYANSTSTFQSVSLNFGTIGGTGGLTQFASTTASYTLRGISQDGAPPGAFTSLSTTSAGDIVANFDNGQSRILNRVPIITFPDANALQRQDNNGFTGTTSAGNPLAHDAGSEGAGTLVTKSTEASNVDIGKEFTNLIVAQRAYTANAKLVTTADDMLQTTIDLKR